MTADDQPDGVDLIVEQWARERPDLDVSPMGVFGRLARANRLMEQQLDVAFARHGLDSGSFDVLATLLRTGPPHRLTAGQLQRSSMITSSAVAQRLNRLAARGLVTRSPNAADARATDVTLTADGHALISAAVPDHVANEHRLLGGLSEQQRSELADLLRALTSAIQDAPEPPTRSVRSRTAPRAAGAVSSCGEPSPRRSVTARRRAAETGPVPARWY